MHENFANASWNYPIKHPQAIVDPQLACSDCCEECSAPFTPQCNEKCMIVPCQNQEYSGVACHLLSENCENVECVSTIIPNCKTQHNSRNDCSKCYDEYRSYSHFPQNQGTQSPTAFQVDPPIQNFLYNRAPQNIIGSPSSSTSSGSSTCSHTDFLFSPKDAFSTTTSMSVSSPPTSPDVTTPLFCMWGDCHACFSSLNELVGHVNVVHLQLSKQMAPQTSTLSKAPFLALQCQWRDCHAPHPQFPVENVFSSTESLETMLDVLSNHLLHDHLKASVSQSPLLPEQLMENHESSLLSAPQISDVIERNETHVCHWYECSEVFATLEDLTAHITAAHVGSGKAQYECFWENCNRSGSNGFSSKQKICRHIQSHTGHRPFQCKICNQSFSEAATLQQHMRRHTHEKPYVCDYPGCSKSFAIAGALTIHKRVHNGEKPFKCKFCDKAFAESSNLSKHLRTHTGVRPYTCPEPGCGKSFARPDQLTRHSLVHKKKGSS